MIKDDQIVKIFAAFLNGLGEELRAKTPSVSGRSRALITSEVTQEGDFGRLVGRLYGPSYIEVFEYGRGPTRPNAPKGSPTMRERILEWIEAKNIRFTKAVKKGGATIIRTLTAEQMSWIIAAKIHREGNRLYRELKGGNTGYLSNTITDVRVTAFLETFGERYQRLLLADVIKTFTPRATK